MSDHATIAITALEQAYEDACNEREQTVAAAQQVAVAAIASVKGRRALGYRTWPDGTRGLVEVREFGGGLPAWNVADDDAVGAVNQEVVDAVLAFDKAMWDRANVVKGAEDALRKALLEASKDQEPPGCSFALVLRANGRTRVFYCEVSRSSPRWTLIPCLAVGAAGEGPGTPAKGTQR